MRTLPSGPLRVCLLWRRGSISPPLRPQANLMVARREDVHAGAVGMCCAVFGARGRSPALNSALRVLVGLQKSGRIVWAPPGARLARAGACIPAEFKHISKRRT